MLLCWLVLLMPFLPNVLVADANEKTELLIFKDRFRKNETLICVCLGGECKLPVRSIEEVLEEIGPGLNFK